MYFCDIFMMPAWQVQTESKIKIIECPTMVCVKNTIYIHQIFIWVPLKENMFHITADLATVLIEHFS